MSEHRSSSKAVEKRDHTPEICCPCSSHTMGMPQPKLKGPGIFPPSGILPSLGCVPSSSPIPAIPVIPALPGTADPCKPGSSRAASALTCSHPTGRTSYSLTARPLQPPSPAVNQQQEELSWQQEPRGCCSMGKTPNERLLGHILPPAVTGSCGNQGRGCWGCQEVQGCYLPPFQVACPG